MTKPPRFGSALSMIALASVLGGCAAPHSGPTSASIFGSKIDKSNIALATRAAAALAAEDFAKAVDLAERAVVNSERDAGFRALLGNAYFGSGRFASAEAAYRDSLSLLSNQPQVVLKLALVQIAQGKSREALAFLEAARPVLDRSDYGLALALAGQPGRAVAVLEPAAREVGADAQLRQNLALAYALTGDWTAARTVAAQDLSPNLVDSRIEQWMVFAKPARASDQVAALMGVTPAASDPGQPVRLALSEPATRHAAVVAPQRKAPPQAAAEPVRARAAVPAAAVPAVVAAPQAVEYRAPAVEQFQPQVAVRPADQVSEAAPVPVPAPAPVVALAPPEPPVRAAPAPAKAPVVRAAAFVPAKRPTARPASLPRVQQGRSSAVVQLGAYGSPQRVLAAWNQFAQRFEKLRGYSPISARFESSRGTVYRLSVRGFASAGEANALCSGLKRQGKNCFVRSVAGDTPVRFAAR